MPREGFQAPPPPCTDCVKCDATRAITNFPLGLGNIPGLKTLYDSVEEPISIYLSLATSSIAPQFIDNTTGMIYNNSVTSGQIPDSPTQSTVRYNNTSYSLYSVQITVSTHTSWIIPTPAENINKEDLIITFYTNNQTATNKYIIIVIPLLRKGTRNDPQYLTGLNNPTSSGEFKLSDCLPAKRSQFILYSSCIDGYTQHKNPINVYIFVSVVGKEVTPDLMNRLSSNNMRFKAPFLPFMSTTSILKTILQNSDFTSYVQSTTHLLDYEYTSSAYGSRVSDTRPDNTSSRYSSRVSDTRTDNTNSRVSDTRSDNTSSYQCVPLDPDNDIVDGKMEIDLTNGTVLTNVLAERDAVRAASGPVEKTEEQKKKIGERMGHITGIIFGSLVVFGAIYILGKKLGWMSPRVPDPAAAAAAAATTATAATAADGYTSWLPTAAIVSVVSIATGIGGYFLGLTH